MKQCVLCNGTDHQEAFLLEEGVDVHESCYVQYLSKIIESCSNQIDGKNITKEQLCNKGGNLMASPNEYRCGFCITEKRKVPIGKKSFKNVYAARPCDKCVFPKILHKLDNTKEETQ